MRKLVLLASLSLGVLLLTAACSGVGRDVDKSRQDNVVAREQVFRRAEALIPQPIPSNFPLRKALVKFTERQDQIDHPWYVYILGEQGNAVAYYVAQTVPINSCNFLSSTERLTYAGNSTYVKVTAPSLDGIFYGGGGTSAGCDSWFFFDAATDALIQIRGVNWYAADQPLRVEASPIMVEIK